MDDLNNCNPDIVQIAHSSYKAVLSKVLNMPLFWKKRVTFKDILRKKTEAAIGDNKCFIHPIKTTSLPTCLQ